MTEIWLDYSFARPDLHVAKRSGAAGLFRYLAPISSNTRGKVIDLAEWKAIHAVGLDVVLNFEWYQGRCLEGHPAGVADGKIAYEQARQLGYAKGATIVFSHDTGTRNDAAVAAYLAGAQSQMHGYYNVEGNAVYSGKGTVDAMVARGAAVGVWQTGAWSGGERSPHAHFYQNGKQWFHGGADENVRLRKDSRFVSHREALAAAAAPAAPPRHAKPGPSSNPKPRPLKPVPAGGTYTVRSGDTLVRIAARHGTTWRKLWALNKGRRMKDGRRYTHPGAIYVGWVLKLPGSKNPVHPVKTVVKKVIVPKRKRYTVRSGDTLSSIADRFGVPGGWRRLQTLNRLKNINLIFPGQVLRIAK